MRNLLLTLFLALSIQAFSQFQQNHLVEYFTNTLCSICANRNPGFHSNLENSNNTILISFHPSSPYSACVLNQFNKQENDSRTQFYNIYGGTPRLVINGTVLPASENYSSPQVFPQESDSEYNIEASNNPVLSSQGISAEFKISSTQAQSGLTAFLYLVEDTVFYNAPNGEDQHYNVFRSSLSGIEGIALEEFSDSTVLTIENSQVELEGVDLDRLHLISFLMNSESEVVQANQYAVQNNTSPASVEEKEGPKLSLQRISGTYLYQFSDQQQHDFIIRNLNGQQIKSGFNNQVDLGELPQGMYLIETNLQVLKVIK